VKNTGLPIPLFLGGHHRFVVFTKQQRDGVVAINTNYIIGHNKKKSHFQGLGRWVTDSE